MFPKKKHTLAIDLLDCPSPWGVKKVKPPRFQLPPSNPEDIRVWFRAVVHRKKSTENATELVKRNKQTSVDIPVPSRHGESDALPPLPVHLNLKETETIWLLTVLTSYSPDEAEDVDRATKENETYSKLLKEGVKRIDAETQTPKLPDRWKGCETTDVRIANSFINASAWDLYDTYAQVGEEAGFGIKEFQLLIDTALKSRGVLAAQFVASEITRQPADKQMRMLIKTSEFQYCALVIERLLASKTFQNKQCLLERNSEENYDEVGPSLFSYEIKWLWTYDNKFSNHCVATALDWNARNPGLLAVGYEKGDAGCVCVWSPKNPSYPERKINIPSQVTTLCFSRTRPHIMAVGCRSGDILMLDVSENGAKMRHFPRGKIKAKFGPIWRVEWFFQSQQESSSQEDLMALGESGALLHLSLHDESLSLEVVTLQYTTQVTSLLLEPRVEYTAKSLSGLWFSLVPSKHICYVSTKEGIVVKCIIRKPCYTDVRLSAHLGPVYVVQHSPATSMVFLTSGADHCFKIWVEGIDQPLLTLYSPNRATMVFAQWSPNLPTVIATLSDSELGIWDLARKPNEPINTLRIRASESAFSTLRFFPDGKGIVVGDQRGHVRVYQLSELPREPFLKVEALTKALQIALEKHPERLYQFNKLVHFHKNEFKTFVT